MTTKAWLWWSSGKDSAWSLHVLRDDPAVEVTTLVTTVNEVFDRVAMHAVRTELLRHQAAAVGLPLRVVPIPHPCSNAEYEAAVAKLVDDARAQGVEAMAFGDLFLEDVRHYREELFGACGMSLLFPLWGEDTSKLAHRMVDAGLRAYLTCVDPKALDAEFAGRVFDERLLAELPPGVDPCGENGEFHTFVFRGPMLREPMEVRVGERVEREGFVFADVSRPSHGGS